jgi:hypothetical protein
MSSISVIIQLKCDFKETKTDHVQLKLCEIYVVYLENIFHEKNLAIITISDPSNIGFDYQYCTVY